MKTTTKTIKILGDRVFPASIPTGSEKYLSHHLPGIPQHDEEYGFFKYITLRNLTIEHFLVVIGLSFYVVGSLQIYPMQKSDNDIQMSYLLFLVFLTLTLIKLIQLKKNN